MLFEDIDDPVDGVLIEELIVVCSVETMWIVVTVMVVIDGCEEDTDKSFAIGVYSATAVEATSIKRIMKNFIFD